jgi:TolB-like protein
MKRLTLLALACLVFGPAAASAQSTAKVKIAVLDLKEQGVDKALASSASSLLAAELQKLDVFKVISREDIRSMLQFEKDKQTLGCEADSACMAELGGALGVDYTVSGQLAKIGDGFVLTLTLANAKSASVENRATETVQRQDQIVAAVGRSARILVSKILKGREGYLVLTAVEEGALVKVDGAARGTTPIKGRIALSWGPHLLEVEKAGFITYAEDISIPARQALAKSVALVPSNDFIDRYEGSAKKMRIGAWISSGLAVAGAATAIAFNQMSGSTESQFVSKRTAYTAPTSAQLSELQDLSNKGSSQVFVARLGLGIGAAALALAGYFWIAGDDPHKYENYRELAPSAAPPEAPPAAPAAAPGAAPSAPAGPSLIPSKAKSKASLEGGQQGFALSAAAVPVERGAALVLGGRF